MADARVGIIMGSRSDEEVMREGAALMGHMGLETALENYDKEQWRTKLKEFFKT